MSDNPLPCGCGRSPTGFCMGFHSLSDQEWIEGRTQLVHRALTQVGHKGAVLPPELAQVPTPKAPDEMA